MALRPDAVFSICPPIRPLAAQWSMRHFLEELYWKGPHFGFGRHGWQLTAAQHRTLHSEFTSTVLAGLVEKGIDPIEQILTRTARLFGAPSGKYLQHLLDHWRGVETTL